MSAPVGCAVPAARSELLAEMKLHALPNDVRADDGKADEPLAKVIASRGASTSAGGGDVIPTATSDSRSTGADEHPQKSFKNSENNSENPTAAHGLCTDSEQKSEGIRTKSRAGYHTERFPTVESMPLRQ